jgi:hypothetical protein
MGPHTLVARWTLADGAVLRLVANLAATAYVAPPLRVGTPLLATTDSHGSEWPPWFVEWALEH